MEAISFMCGVCLAGVRGRDMRPAAHLLFLTRQEKKAKEGDPTGRVPFAALRGNLRCSDAGRHCGTRFAATQRRSNNRSESEHEAGACCAAPARPTPCASRHVHRGRETIGAIAVLGRGPRAERSDGPSGCSSPLEAAPAARFWRGGDCSAGCSRFVN